MSWFSFKKNNNIPDPKLTSATCNSPDDKKNKNDESKKQEEETPGKKKFGTWGKKIGKKLKKQNRRSKSTGSSKTAKREDIDYDDEIDIEKETTEFVDLKRASRIDALKKFFRPINIENNETINKIKTVSNDESLNPLGDDILVESETEINESSSEKKDIQDVVVEMNNVQDVADEENIYQDVVDEKKMILKINESDISSKKSLQRSSSMNVSEKMNNDLNFISDSLVKFSKNLSSSKIQEEKKTNKVRRSLTISTVTDIRQMYQQRRESGYDSDTGSAGSCDSINTLTATTQISNLSINSEVLRHKNIDTVEYNETNNKQTNPTLSNNDISSVETDSDNASSIVNDSSRKNSWSDEIYQTQNELFIWPETSTSNSTSQSSSNDNKLTEINSTSPKITGTLKKDEKYFSTMTLNYTSSNDVNNFYNQTTGMKKFQIIRKNNVTQLELTQLADSLLMLLITVILWKGDTKKLGFSIVGGADNKFNKEILIKSILKDGQAAENGLLQPGDMILAINGQLIDRLMTHGQVLQIIKNAKPGKIIFHVGRKY